MTVKLAQYIDVDYDESTDEQDSSYADDFEVDMDENETSENDDEDSDEDADEDDDLVVLELKPSEEFVFNIPDIPGALDMSDIPSPEEIEAEEEPEEAVDEWNWESKGHSGFLHWLFDMVQNTPKHSGRDVGGLERAISRIERLLQIRSKAMRTDYKGEIDVNKCEEMSDSLYNALDRMEERKNQIQRYKFPNRFKNKKTAELESGLVKEGQKHPGITGITITVPLFISRLARVIINGTISGGHSIEDQYDELKKEYDLTKREEAELQQLIADMGYPIYQDRGKLNQQVDKTKSDNFDWAANYNG